MGREEEREKERHVCPRRGLGLGSVDGRIIEKLLAVMNTGEEMGIVNIVWLNGNYQQLFDPVSHNDSNLKN